MCTFIMYVYIHCVCVPQLSYTFICQWASKLLPCPGYCKQCCDEHWGICVSFNSVFLSVYAQHWDCCVIVQFSSAASVYAQEWDCCVIVQFSSATQSCRTLCDPINCSTPGLPVHHHLPEFTQTQVHRICDAIQPSHPQSSLSPPAPNSSQHQSLFQLANSSH